MQNNDTTIFNFSEKADEVMEELVAAGMHGSRLRGLPVARSMEGVVAA